MLAFSPIALATCLRAGPNCHCFRYKMLCWVITARPIDTHGGVVRDSDENDRTNETFLSDLICYIEFGELQTKFESSICH